MNNLTPQEREGLREEWNRFCKEFIHGTRYRSLPDIADWWLSKIEAHDKALLEGIEGMKKNHGYDLPTNDYCYSEHDVNNSYDKACNDILDFIKNNKV